MLYALVVIYNKKCVDSKTLNSIERYSNNQIKVIVFDNSETDFNNKEYCQKKGYSYYTKKKNIGLSKSYNYVIEKIKKNDNDYLIILDDDTELNSLYFEELLMLLEKNNYDIILPVVKSKRMILSPSNVLFDCRIKKIYSLNEIDLNRITAINSGMIVKLNVYNKVKYNEEMFLDYVDHDFMRNCRKYKFKIFIMNSEIFQNFSREEEVSYDSFKSRFKIYKKDFKVYCKNCNKLLYYYFSILKLKLVSYIKYKK